MAPQKRSRNSPTKLKQTTLIDHAQSSPPSTRKSSRYASSVSPKKRIHTQASGSSDDSSDIAAIKFQPVGEEVDDEDEEIQSSVKRRRITRAVSDSDSSVVITAVKRKGKLPAPPKKNVKTASDSDSEGIKPRKRRKLIKGKRPANEESSDDDLEPERKYSDILRFRSDPEPDILNTRLRTRGKKTEFQKNLERLRRAEQASSLSQCD
ncbi:hypothetical protein MPER_08663 [Moniliophthora perniciosa FA553]|nr:hypothetical protein MPER_08663 [Moniliophthora perniciosa FA553]